MPNLFILAAFVMLGILLVNERRILSRFTSASILLMLGAIAIRVGHTALADAYLLALALCLAVGGAQPLLHRKYKSTRETAILSVFIVCFGVVFFYVFTDIMTMLQGISIYENSL